MTFYFGEISSEKRRRKNDVTTFNLSQTQLNELTFTELFIQ